MKLKEVLYLKRITQSKLSMMANINATQLNKAINGKIEFFPNWRKRIAQALEMHEDELFPEYREKGGR